MNKMAISALTFIEIETNEIHRRENREKGN